MAMLVWEWFSPGGSLTSGNGTIAVTGAGQSDGGNSGQDILVASGFMKTTGTGNITLTGTGSGSYGILQ